MDTKINTTRWVDGTPTTEVTPVTISGRSITWPWSPNDHGHGHEWPTVTPFVQCQSSLPFWDTAISKFDHENLRSRSSWVCGQRSRLHLTFKGQGQTHWSHLRPGVQSICLLFVSWKSDHFWLRYSKFYVWPRKFMVKPNGHIWALEFNWYVCFSFRGNRTIFGWDIANSIFDLENSRPRSNPMVTFEP